MKKYRFFGSFLKAQEKWLNKLSAHGYRLVRTGKLLYEFESCAPNEVQYCVEFIGEKSHENAEDYRLFLENMGYTVFYKNINLSYSIGKVRYRPWADKGGRIATNRTTYDRELLIIAKENDGKPFQIHTAKDDIVRYYSRIRAAWFSFFIIFGACGMLSKSLIFGIVALISLVPTIIYQITINRTKREHKLEE